MNSLGDSGLGDDKHNLASWGFGKLDYLLQTVTHFQRGQTLFPVSFLNYLPSTIPPPPPELISARAGKLQLVQSFPSRTRWLKSARSCQQLRLGKASQRP